MAVVGRVDWPRTLLTGAEVADVADESGTIGAVEAAGRVLVEAMGAVEVAGGGTPVA
ncbi:hypothetical protein D3C80_2032510 [compost metagenome]